MELFNNHTALIIIDMQKAFVEPGAPLCVKGAKATVPGSDVEFTRYQTWEEGGRPLAHGSKGIGGAEEAEGLERKPGDYVVIKPRWSGFFQTELDLILRRLHIDTVVLIGTTTPNCVRTTCYDAIALDYKTIVIERCCSSNTEEIQRVNMEDMERIGAVILR